MLVGREVEDPDRAQRRREPVGRRFEAGGGAGPLLHQGRHGAASPLVHLGVGPRRGGDPVRPAGDDIGTAAGQVGDDVLNRPVRARRHRCCAGFRREMGDQLDDPPTALGVGRTDLIHARESRHGLARRRPAGLYAPTVVLFCPRCGVELPVQFRGEWFSTNPRCLDCGVALAETPPMLAPSEEELQYGLDEWPLPDRVALTIALAADGIPYRWERDIVLVVPEVAEEEVDVLLDHLEAQDPEFATEGAVGFDGAGEAPDGGEEAQAAMVELFLAADRLRHSPLDQVVAADLEVAAEAVAARLPPYGIDPRVWAQIQQMAAATVSSSIDEAVGEEVVAADATTLRDFLRDYV